MGAADRPGDAVREFLVETALPFIGVCATVSGLTATIFDVPAAPPTKAAPPAAIVVEPQAQGPAGPRREQVTEVLSRAMRNLDAARLPRGPSPNPTTKAPTVPEATPGTPLAVAGPGAAPTPGLGVPLVPGEPTQAPTDPSLLAAVKALGDAVKTVHEVRTEEDLVQAEGRMRAAREQMEAACKNGAGPLCEGAEQMKQLGY